MQNTFPVIVLVIIMFAGSVVRGQVVKSTFDARILPDLEQLKSVEQLDPIFRKTSHLEEKELRDAADDKAVYCETLFNFVVFRYRLHRAAVGVTSGPDRLGPRSTAELYTLLDKNVVRAESLFSDGEKKCFANGYTTTDVFQMAKFCNAWLLDNITTTLTPTHDPKKLDAQNERVLGDYEAVLKEFRSRSDKSWINPTLLLYSFSSSLLKRAQFARAESLLSDAIAFASKKYGPNSPAGLPTLILLEGIANTVGNQAEHDNYANWIKRINGDQPQLGEVFFDLGPRAALESRSLLESRGDVKVFSTREGLANTRNERLTSRDILQPATIDLRDMSIFSTLQATTKQGVPYQAVITVDEKGIVTEVDASRVDDKTRRKLKEVASGIRFEPLIYKGRASSMRGFVYIYLGR